jgi:hypothetical protein
MEESPDHLPAVGPDMDDDTVALADLVPLVRQLRAGGYRVIGPTVRDGAIVLAELESADDLPYGWGVETSPGRYRLRRRVDRAAFGHAAGPQAWKRFLHPPREPVLSASRHGGRLAFDSPDEPAERYAFLGVRPCDLRAITGQDRVLGARGSRCSWAWPTCRSRAVAGGRQESAVRCRWWGAQSPGPAVAAHVDDQHVTVGPCQPAPQAVLVPNPPAVR